MGAWNPEPFGNDDALDFLDEVAGDGLFAIGAALQPALERGGLEAPEAARVVAAAALVAASHGADVGLSDEAKAMAAQLHAPHDLLPVARKALEKVVAHSELEALWAEGEGYDGWLASVSRIQAALK